MKKPISFVSYVLPILFIGMLFLPIFNSFTHVWAFERKDENRAFKDSISIDIQRLDNFPNDFNDFYNDNFSFRSPLLNIYHHLKFYYFKISPHPKKTIIGSNGWFFMAEKEQKIFQGELNFNQQDLTDLQAEWQYRKQYLDSLGIQFYWLIAPMKHNIYPEYLPFNIRGSDTRRVSLLKSYFDTVMPNIIIDPVPELLSAKKHRKLFYKLDNHWNHEAAEIVSNILVKRIKKDFPEKFIVNPPTVAWYDSVIQKGIHYRVLGVEDLIESERYPVFTPLASKVQRYGFKCVEGFAYPWEYEFRYQNSTIKDNGLRILVIRDSFFGHVMPFLAESFSESVYIFDAWQYKLNKEIIEKVKPDIVIFECMEVHIESIIDRYRKYKKGKC